MPALPPKADMRADIDDVCFVPIATVAPMQQICFNFIACPMNGFESVALHSSCGVRLTWSFFFGGVGFVPLAWLKSFTALTNRYGSGSITLLVPLASIC